MSEKIIINLFDLPGCALYGYNTGLKARKKFKLDELDLHPGGVHVVSNEEFCWVTSTFIFGFFEKSILHFKSKDAFYTHYSFTPNSYITRQLPRCLERILFDPNWTTYQ